MAFNLKLYSLHYISLMFDKTNTFIIFILYIYIYIYIYFQLHSSLGIRLELLVFFIALCWLLMKLQKRKLFDTVN